MKTERIGDVVVVTGVVSFSDVAMFSPGDGPEFNYYHTVDLSRAEFVEEEVRQTRIYGYGHSGPICSGKATVKKVSSLVRLVEGIFAGTVILPPDVTRKQLNAFAECEDIGRFVVTDDCKLFSMKDGDIWNKKGTILVRDQSKADVLVTCENCGHRLLTNKGEKTADGGFVCPWCRWERYDNPDAPYVPYKGVYYRKDDPRLADLLSREGMTLEDYIETI